MKILEEKPRELKNEAKRGKRGEKEATREAQRRPKRGQGGPKRTTVRFDSRRRVVIFGPRCLPND